MIDGASTVQAGEKPSPEAAPPTLRALGCPRCGGSLEVHEGAPLVACGYCGSAFLARTPDGTFRFLTRAKLSRAEAEAVVREALRSSRCPPDLATGATRVSSTLLYVPFWRFRATFVGRVSGLRDIVSRRPVRVYHGNESGAETTVQMEEVCVGEEEAIEEIQEIWKATVTACPLEDLGIPQLSSRRQMAGGLSRLAAGSGELPDLIPAHVDLPDGTLIDPMVPAEEARREAAAVFERFVNGRGAELRERRLVYERLQERESLVFYPVYRVRFQYRGRIYEATVDGLEGHLVRAVLPSAPPEILPVLLLAAAGGLCLGAMARMLVWPPPLFPELATAAGRIDLLAVVLGGTVALAFGLRSLAGRLLRGERDDVVIS